MAYQLPVACIGVERNADDRPRPRCDSRLPPRDRWLGGKHDCRLVSSDQVFKRAGDAARAGAIAVAGESACATFKLSPATRIVTVRACEQLAKPFDQRLGFSGQILELDFDKPAFESFDGRDGHGQMVRLNSPIRRVGPPEYDGCNAFCKDDRSAI